MPDPDSLIEVGAMAVWAAPTNAEARENDGLKVSTNVVPDVAGSAVRPTLLVAVAAGIVNPSVPLPDGPARATV